MRIGLVLAVAVSSGSPITPPRWRRSSTPRMGSPLGRRHRRNVRWLACRCALASKRPGVGPVSHHCRGPAPVQPAGHRRGVAGTTEFPPQRLGSFVGRPRVPTQATIAAWVRRPWRLDPLSFLVSILPDGALELAAHLTAVEAVLGPEWPLEDLWVCAVRQKDLRRVVFGRDARAALAAAVCASCSVPGFFLPVRIDDRSYFDGGVRSPTNADVLRHRELDLAIIISPDVRTCSRPPRGRQPRPPAGPTPGRSRAAPSAEGRHPLGPHRTGSRRR